MCPTRSSRLKTTPSWRWIELLAPAVVVLLATSSPGRAGPQDTLEELNAVGAAVQRNQCSGEVTGIDLSVCGRSSELGDDLFWKLAQFPALTRLDCAIHVRNARRIAGAR